MRLSADLEPVARVIRPSACTYDINLTANAPLGGLVPYVSANRHKAENVLCWNAHHCVYLVASTASIASNIRYITCGTIAFP